MKRVLAVCLVLALSACASTGEKDSSGYDEAFMAKVEQQALQRGVIVQWIHPPKAPKTPKAKKDGQ